MHGIFSFRRYLHLMQVCEILIEIPSAFTDSEVGLFFPCLVLCH